MDKTLPFDKFVEKYGSLGGELWLGRKSDNFPYREFYFEDGKAVTHVTVEHSLDDVLLPELYKDTEHLYVVQKDNGTFILYRTRWEDIFPEDPVEKNNPFVQTSEQWEEVQHLIKCALYYFGRRLLVDSNTLSLLGSYCPELLKEYLLYLDLKSTDAEKLLHSYPIETIEEVCRRTLGTIYGSLEMKYFFYILYTGTQQALTTKDEVIELGAFLGYSEKAVTDFIKQIVVLQTSDISSLTVPDIMDFKESITKPYKRIAPFSRMVNVKSVEAYPEISVYDVDTTADYTTDFEY